MTAPSASTAGTAPLTRNTAGERTLSPALSWLVGRAVLDEETQAAVRAASPAALAHGATDPGAVISALVAAGKAPAALRMLACALPPRESVWWAWVAARHAATVQQQRASQQEHEPPDPDVPRALPPSPLVLETLAAVEQWIAQPTDDNRRAVWALAEKVGIDTPAGAVATAAFFTNGSLTPPGGPFVPAPAGLYTTLASAAVIASAVATDVERLGEVASAFIAQGLEVIKRLGGWDAALVSAKQTFDAQAELHAEASKPPKLPNA